jgi:hypothetical protein
MRTAVHRSPNKNFVDLSPYLTYAVSTYCGCEINIKLAKPYRSQTLQRHPTNWFFAVNASMLTNKNAPLKHVNDHQLWNTWRDSSAERLVFHKKGLDSLCNFWFYSRTEKITKVKKPSRTQTQYWIKASGDLKN